MEISYDILYEYAIESNKKGKPKKLSQKLKDKTNSIHHKKPEWGTMNENEGKPQIHHEKPKWWSANKND